MKNKNQLFGYIVLVMGLILLLVTFFLALYMVVWNSTMIENYQSLVETTGGGIDNLVNVMLFFIPLVILLIMGSTGGRIAKYGIKLVRSPENNSKDHLLIKEGAK